MFVPKSRNPVTNLCFSSFDFTSQLLIRISVHFSRPSYGEWYDIERRRLTGIITRDHPKVACTFPSFYKSRNTGALSGSGMSRNYTHR